MNFDEYKKLGEPEKIEKMQNWQIAIGLQKVDGLHPSPYLYEIAKANIDGDITFEEANQKIANYYQTLKERKDFEDRTEEADKVSAKITQILSEQSFSFSLVEFISIHKRLFEGFDFAGQIRNYNVSKEEWVLENKSVFYGSYLNIISTLEYDFKHEREFDYKSLTQKEKVNHIAQFVSNIWQVHPFAEGNTRAAAIFAIKYLRTKGYQVDNTMFDKYSWYFRNALVRANYSDYNLDVLREVVFLENFFGNLLLNENHKLKNREMHISYKGDGDTVNLKNDTVKESFDTVKVKNDTVNRKIVQFIADDEGVTAEKMSELLNLSLSTVKRRLKKLKENGTIERTGSDKAGKWKVSLKQELKEG